MLQSNWLFNEQIYIASDRLLIIEMHKTLNALQNKIVLIVWYARANWQYAVEKLTKMAAISALPLFVDGKYITNHITFHPTRVCSLDVYFTSLQLYNGMQI